MVRTLIVLILMVDGSLSAAAETGLVVGYGEADITPPLGVTMPGYFRVRRASGVLDPLLAKALVVTKGQATIAVVALDLIGVNASLVGEIRKAVQEQSGILGAATLFKETLF